MYTGWEGNSWFEDIDLSTTISLALNIDPDMSLSQCLWDTFCTPSSEASRDRGWAKAPQQSQSFMKRKVQRPQGVTHRSPMLEGRVEVILFKIHHRIRMCFICSQDHIDFGYFGIMSPMSLHLMVKKNVRKLTSSRTFQHQGLVWARDVCTYQNPSTTLNHWDFFLREHLQETHTVYLMGTLGKLSGLNYQTLFHWYDSIEGTPIRETTCSFPFNWGTILKRRFNLQDQLTSLAAMGIQ